MELLKRLIPASRKKENKRRSLQLFLTGFSMGSADIVPGVSGGTIAFILGVYEELIFSIKTVSSETLKLALRGKFKEAWKSVPFNFLVPLGLGILAALFSLAKGIAYLLENQPVYIWSFFFGLVLISIFIVGKRVGKWSASSAAALVIGAVAAYTIVGLVPQETPATIPYFFAAGAIAIVAMILPGVSGSFLLIMMGKYTQILGAVNNKDVLTLGVVAAGAVVGLGLFSRVLNWLFNNYHNVVIATLTGFMVGSLRKVWPWKETLTTRINSHGIEVPVLQVNALPETFDITVIVAALLAVSAISLMLYVEKIQVTREQDKGLNKEFTKEHRKAVKKTS